MKKNIVLLFQTLVLIVSASVRISLFGQSYYAIDEPKKDYWQVYTDYRTGNTVVQFFNARHQLMYTETLPGKYLKLSKKNVRRFDQLLSSLTDTNLLTATIKTHELVADSRTTFRKIYEPEPYESAPANYHHTNTTNVFMLREGKIRVILKNPYRDLIDMTILDQHQRPVHNETIYDSDYSRWFDMSKLAQGVYKLLINGPGLKLHYKVTINDYPGFTLEHL